MAIAKGTQSNFERKLYIGTGNVKVLSIQPTKEELEKIYKNQSDKEPEYISTITRDGKDIPSVRIDIIVQTDPKSCNGIETISKMSYFIRKEPRVNKDGTKIQVIDKYGRTAWVTNEQFKTKEIPMYKNGPANLDKDYRATYTGEEDFTNFIKTYLRIPNVMKWVDGKWELVDNVEDCEARLDNIENYFQGDFSELRILASLQPENKVKVMFGVKSTDNGQFQAIYTNLVLSPYAVNLTKLDADLQERVNMGAYSNVEFSTKPIKEYTIEATDFTEQTETISSPWD